MFNQSIKALQPFSGQTYPRPVHGLSLLSGRRETGFSRFSEPDDKRLQDFGR